MFNTRRHTSIAAVAIAILEGCAQTPAQVAATEPVRVVRITGNPARMAACLTARMEEMSAGWTVSVRGDTDRMRIQTHGGAEVGTIALIAFNSLDASIHLSPNVMTPGYMADKLEEALRACETP